PCKGRLHAAGVGGPDAPLVEAPGRAGVRLRDLLDDLDVARQADLGAAKLMGDQHVEQAGVGYAREEGLRELAGPLDLVGGVSDRRRELACRVEERASTGVGCTHGRDRTRMRSRVHPVFRATSCGLRGALPKLVAHMAGDLQSSQSERLLGLWIAFEMVDED